MQIKEVEELRIVQHSGQSNGWDEEDDVGCCDCDCDGICILESNNMAVQQMKYLMCLNGRMLSFRPLPRRLQLISLMLTRPPGG